MNSHKFDELVGKIFVQKLLCSKNERKLASKYFSNHLIFFFVDREPKPMTKVYFSLVSTERCYEMYKDLTSISKLFPDGFSSAIICAEDTETLASHCLVIINY